MFKSIRSILYACFFVVGVSLFLVVILGLRQFQLSRHYNEITVLSETALFSFSTIREQVTESLISRDFRQTKKVIPSIEQLNSTISRLYDSEFIPDNYQLALTDNIDLPGLVLAINKLDDSADNAEASLELQQEMRRLSQNLIKVDRLISGRIRDSVAGFQLSVIGVMGVLISCASFILIILYRKAVKPLLVLSAQAKNETLPEAGFACPVEAGEEILQFVHSVNQLMDQRLDAQHHISEEEERQIGMLSTMVNETTNGLNGMINYAQLLLESDNSIQLSTEQRTMLEKIISSGERVASQWQTISQRFST